MFNILAESYVEEGIPFYRSSNVGAVVPRSAGLVYISEKRHSEEQKTALKRGDIMLAKTGKEAASVVLVAECKVSQDVVALRPDRTQINPFYLAVFLNTEAGILQMRRWFQGQVQMHLSLPDTREILVPILDPTTQSAVEALVVDSEAWGTAAHKAIAAAESRLMEALELDNLNLASDHHQVASFGTMARAQRYDAEHFCMPGLSKWDSPFPTVPLGNPAVASWVSNGATPATTDYAEVGFPIIKVGDVDSDALATWGGERVREDAPAARARRGALEKTDVVVLCAAHHIRYIGKEGLFEGIEGYTGPVRSVGELITVRAGSKINAQSLCLYLNLPAVRAESQRHVRGLTAHLYPDDFRQIPVPLLPRKLQEELADSFTWSLDARREAARLLEEAKMTVEDTIAGGADEKGE